ncbi:hypothetical protein HYH02_006978 [Chlamydomonas schloesseri]|uniref:FAD/NAD(P)-binding domain-containing protein n=1 Tax=Chlamydomonas schloesseri TaxID=2026947 RepID=A0A835WID7_9CHLO|nr:hypothetical protein HYH02_006978 [Chlamydomonas schloesseri]|eukprot:KAG2447947.1 hypothetical protein HYH02_006978 [Chlamydomonas schloesseri]
MKPTASPKELVLLGGGHSHVEVLRSLGQQRQQAAAAPAAAGGPAPPPPSSPPPPPRVTLISRGRWTPYSGMLPGWAAGFYTFRQVHIDLQRLAAYAGARLVLGEAVGVDVQDRRVLLAPPPPGAGDGGAPAHPSSGQQHHLHRQAVQQQAQAQAQVHRQHPNHCNNSSSSSSSSRYDVLSINTGITPGAGGVPGAQDHTTPVKPIDGFVRRFEGLLQRYRDAAAKASILDQQEEGEQEQESSSQKVGTGGGGGGGGGGQRKDDPRRRRRPVMRVVVVGGGAGGVELAAAVRYRLEEERRRGGWPVACAAAHVSLVCRGGLLPGHPPHVRRLVGRLLASEEEEEGRLGLGLGLGLGVEVRQRAEVTRVSPGRLHLRPSGPGQGEEQGAEVLLADEVLWCTQAAPPEWLAASGLPTDGRGFLALNECLQADGGPPEVFGAGDVASVSRHPRPKAGVFAVRQGPPLARNLAAQLSGRPLEPFTPQSTALALITLGGRFCIASRTAGDGGGRDPQAARSVAAAGAGAKHSRGTGGAAVGSTVGPTPQAAQNHPGAGAGAGGRSGGGGGGGHGDVEEDAADDGPEWPLGWLLNGCGGLAVRLTGPLLWRWKDGIDRAFMRRYGEGLPPGDWQRDADGWGGQGTRHAE